MCQLIQSNIGIQNHIQTFMSQILIIMKLHH